MTSTSVSASSRCSAALDVGHGARALHGDLLDAEPHRRPAPLRVLDDVLLGGRGAAADEADDGRQERQRRLRSAAKSPSAASTERSCSSRASSSPTPTGRMSSAANDSVPRPAKNRGFRVHDDVRAVAQPAGDRVEQRAVAGDRHRHVGDGVAQRQEDGRLARAAGDLRHLALDPDRAEPVDPLGEQLADPADGQRLLRGALDRHDREASRSAAGGAGAPVTDAPHTMEQCRPRPGVSCSPPRAATARGSTVP